MPVTWAYTIAGILGGCLMVFTPVKHIKKGGSNFLFTAARLSKENFLISGFPNFTRLSF
jgi:hypothetical protein